MRQVVIDSSSILPTGAHSAYTGIRRTALELAGELYRRAESLPFRVTIFAQKLRPPSLDAYGFTSNTSRLRLPRWRAISCLTRSVPVIEWLTNADLIHSTANFTAACRLDRIILTIHDAMFLTHRESHLHKRHETKTILNQAKRVRAVITCSESSKSDILGAMGLPPEKVHVIPWGYNKLLFRPEAEPAQPRGRLAKAFGIKKPYFLSVSCNIGRKRSDVLLTEYLKLAAQDPLNDLVFVWRNMPGQIRRLLHNSRYAYRVHVLENVNDSALKDLYCCSTALFFPSVYEGFGLPILEAMACGTPVVTTAEASLQEVGGDVPIYVSASDPSDLYDAMSFFENRQADANTLRARGIARAAQFSWERCGDMTIELYRNCLGV